MFMKYKSLRFVIYTVLALVILYTGLCCIATLLKAGSQPYLLAGTVRLDFCGYYMMAAANGAACILLSIVLALICIKARKLTKTKEA